jgi:hypothetical protein
MAKQLMKLLLALAVGSPPLKSQPCSPHLHTFDTDMTPSFEVFYPGRGSWYTKGFYLANALTFQKEISEAFKACARRNHPDKSDEAEAHNRMIGCINAKDHFERHFECFEEDPYYIVYLQALHQVHWGGLSQENFSVMLSWRRGGWTAQTVGVMERGRVGALQEQERQNQLTALSKEEREERARWEEERAAQTKREQEERARVEEEKAAQKWAHKSKVRGGGRCP